MPAACEGADLNVIVPSSQQIPTAVLAFIEFASDKLDSMMEEAATRLQMRRRR
jgi:hypothetical protein